MKNRQSDWRIRELQELVFFQRGFDISQAEQEDGDIPVISSSGTKSYHSEAKVKSPGVIIGRKGTLGSIYYSARDYWPHSTTLWSKKLNGNNARFVYYFLHTLKLERFDTGNSNPTLNRNHIHKLEIKIPPLPTQEKIANILSKYDDLIENNRRRIELLEKSARLLYKEWFVYLRIPAHEHTPFIDGIPDGWENKILKELAFLTMGQSPKSEFYNEDKIGLPFHQGVANFGGRFPENKFYSTKESRIAEEGDILFSVRAPVGRMNISLEKIIIGRGLAAIRSKNHHQGFLYYQLKNHFFKEDMIGTGAIFASVTRAGLENVEFITPKDSIIKLFLEQIHPIDNQIKTLHQMNQKLKQARDILLPRLMNGEINV